MTNGRPVAETLTDDDGTIDRPFGGYTVETESLSDGRTIRYYAWPADAEGAADPDPATDGPGTGTA